MPQASPNYNLYVLKPNLVKEWHPTKNAGIKPQEVTPGSGKKVWWICKNSHEWEAVIYSRSKGIGCPYCNDSKSTIGRSFKARTTVTLEVPSSQHLFFAQLKNFSQEGMCLETSAALTPGTKVNIKLDRPLLGSSQESYISVIKWCKGLTDEQGTVHNFGLGVKFI